MCTKKTICINSELLIDTNKKYPNCKLTAAQLTCC